MTIPLSSSDLAAIEARAEAATPWYFEAAKNAAAFRCAFGCAIPEFIPLLIAEIKRLKGEANG